MACDTLGSYGTLAKYKDLRRMAEVNEKCLIGAGGEYSDFQYIQSLLDELRTDDANLADGFTLSPAEIFSYLRVVLYNRRSKFNPLWNNLVVAGFTGGKPFLGTVDLIGTAFEDDLIATGFGAHLALPLMRKALDETPAHLMEEGVARALLEDCLRVLFYRDCRALNRVQVRARPPRRRDSARVSARPRERGRDGSCSAPSRARRPDISLTCARPLALARALFHRARPRSSPRRRLTACSSRTRTSSRPTGTRRASCCPRRARRTTTAVGSGAAARAGRLGPARSRGARLSARPSLALKTNTRPAHAPASPRATQSAARASLRICARGGVWGGGVRARAARLTPRSVSARRPAARWAASARGAWPRTRPTASPPGCRRA